MPTYEDVLTLAQQLNAVEQARLAEALMLIHQPAQTENHLEPSSQTLILNSLKARLQTIPPGVSLVDELIAERRDRACLALAMTLNLPVVTADQAWQALDLTISVQMIR